MKIISENSSGEVTLRISGEIDMGTSVDLRRELMKLTNRKANSIIVDFDKVTFIDSSGIATLVETLKIMKGYNGRLRLIAIPENILEIFGFLKLREVFDIVMPVTSKN